MITRRRHDRCSRAGQSLLEIAIVVTLLVVLLGSVGLVTLTSSGAYESTRRSDDLQARVDRAVNRLAMELLSTGQSVLAPDPNTDWGTDDLGFRAAVGLTAGNVDWSPLSRISFEYELGELDDDVDNNGNGLIDEGRLVLTRNAGLASERAIVLCHGLAELGEGETVNGADDNGDGVRDEGGFNVHRRGDVLTVKLTLEALGDGGVLQQRTISASVRLRN